MSAESRRTGTAEWLLANLRLLRLLLHRRATLSGSSQLDWLLVGDAEGPAADPAVLASIEESIAAAGADLRRLEEELTDEERSPALASLAKLVDLTPLETRVLLLAAAPALDPAFARAYAELNADGGRDHATLGLALAVLVDDPAERLAGFDILLPERPLRALRLLELDGDERDPLALRPLTVDERMVGFLRGASRLDARLHAVLRPVAAAPAGESTDRLAAEVVQGLARQSDRWLGVNLVGGTGTTRAVAELVCARLGLRLFAVDLGRMAERTPHERGLLVALLGREAVLAGLAVLVDTSEVEHGSPAAAVVDELTDGVSAQLFVTGTERWPSDASLQIAHVARPSRHEQADMWRDALSAYDHSLNGEVDAIVQQFDLGPSAIAEAVERAAARTGGEITGTALWRSCRDHASAVLDDLAVPITPAYGWDDIVVGDDVRAQLRELADQVEQRSRVYETWGFGRHLARGRGITALFAGPSGTGKTMAAEILAGHLDLELHRIDLAGVVSKYVGETEKNLRRVFEAAEQRGTILFFDEADALFGTRTQIRDSHDRYANVEINYLLQRMEDYAGLAVLATNRRDALDNAFLRRLRFVVEFPFPDVEDRRRIWERVFPAEAALDEIDFSFLAQLELTGASIRSIAINGAFLAAAAGAPITMPDLMRAAAREYAKLSKPVSSAEFGRYHPAVTA
jgi:hypothetical protein